MKKYILSKNSRDYCQTPYNANEYFLDTAMLIMLITKFVFESFGFYIRLSAFLSKGVPTNVKERLIIFSENCIPFT